jgi:DNA-binding transcriptional LysR family regulator
VTDQSFTERAEQLRAKADAHAATQTGWRRTGGNLVGGLILLTVALVLVAIVAGLGWAFVDSGAWRAVLGAAILIVLVLCVSVGVNRAKR